MLGRLPLVRKFFQMFRNDFDSEAYWSNRYEQGRISGAGSYGRLADYKAEVINSLVNEFEISSVLEFGSGDGNQASLFEIDTYTGLDVAHQVVEAARERFKDRAGWSFDTVKNANTAPRSRDMTMSLDVIYHLVEEAVFDRYLADLFAASDRFVLIYASDHNALTLNSHVKHRCYSDWVNANAPEFGAIRTLKSPFPKTAMSDTKDTSFAFFRLYQRLEA